MVHMLAEPPCGDKKNAYLQVTVHIISLKWQRVLDVLACCSDSFRMLRVVDICEAQQELWQHEKYSHAAVGTKTPAT